MNLYHVEEGAAVIAVSVLPVAILVAFGLIVTGHRRSAVRLLTIAAVVAGVLFATSFVAFTRQTKPTTRLHWR